MKQLTHLQMWRYTVIARHYKILHKAHKGVGLRRATEGVTTYGRIAELCNEQLSQHADRPGHHPMTAGEVNRAVSAIRQRQTGDCEPTGYKVFDKITELPRFQASGSRTYTKAKTLQIMKVIKAHNEKWSADKMCVPLRRSDDGFIDTDLTVGERATIWAFATIGAVGVLIVVIAYGKEISKSIWGF